MIGLRQSTPNTKVNLAELILNFIYICKRMLANQNNTFEIIVISHPTCGVTMQRRAGLFSS